MGMYQIDDIQDVQDLSESGMDFLMECFMFDELYRLPDDKRQNFCESADMQDARKVLMEKGMLNKTALVRLSKAGDMERRTQLAVYALAREHNDPLWRKFLKAQRMKLDTREAMNRKYMSKAKLNARTAQRGYIKKTGNVTNIVLH